MSWLDLVRRSYPLKYVYSDEYWMVDIGPHIFPIKKYRLLYEKLLQSGVKRQNFFTPSPVQDEDLLLVHSPKYIRKLKTGSLSRSEIAVLELPFSPELVRFAWLTCGGTILAAQLALDNGLAVHLGGGFHHAFPDHGEGFCVLNDVAVATEKMRKEGRVKRVMIVDCDVHQGNGTAFIFAHKKEVFTFSIHQMDLYPAEKPPSDLDIELWSGDGDEEYLVALRANFPRLYLQFKPQLVFYLAGADPYEKDQLGSLKLTKEGLKERDKIVIGEARRLDIPVVILLAGGYAFDINDTVLIHLNTIKMAQAIERRKKLSSFLS
ncbi:MAG: histone deacetylase [Candidatus Aminicenantes bacterium]|nr:histone deacetylase [Candidatus Aminicenantes bacterium]